MLTQTRVKGLQDALTDRYNGQQSRLEILNRLALLQREKERITKERENWQKKIDLIGARLEKITEMITQLQQSLITEDLAFDDRTSYQKNISGVIVNEEAFANRVTIHY